MVFVSAQFSCLTDCVVKGQWFCVSSYSVKGCWWRSLSQCQQFQIWSVGMLLGMLVLICISCWEVLMWVCCLYSASEKSLLSPHHCLLLHHQYHAYYHHHHHHHLLLLLLFVFLLKLLHFLNPFHWFVEQRFTHMIQCSWRHMCVCKSSTEAPFWRI